MLRSRTSINLHCLNRNVAPSSCRTYARRRAAPAPAIAGRIESQARRDQRLQREAEAKARANEPWIHITPMRLLTLVGTGLVVYGTWWFWTDPSRVLVLNPKFFTPFIFKSADAHSPTCSTFNLLSLPAGQWTGNIQDAWKRGIWSVQVCQPDLQIARSYTPLPPSQIEGVPEDHQLVRLFVRRTDKGEISSFLHGMSPGTLVHLRGPHAEYDIPDDVEQVLFLAGGTGIAPALQVAYTLYRARAQTAAVPEMRILWANRQRIDSKASDAVQDFRISLAEKIKRAMTPGRRGRTEITQKLDDAPVDNLDQLRRQKQLVQELESFSLATRRLLKINYFVDEEGSYITKDVLEACISPNETVRENSGKKLLLVSGPDGFVEHFAGAKVWHRGQEFSGPLGGMLAKMQHEGWTIHKL